MFRKWATVRKPNVVICHMGHSGYWLILMEKLVVFNNLTFFLDIWKFRQKFSLLTIASSSQLVENWSNFTNLFFPYWWLACTIHVAKLNTRPYTRGRWFCFLQLYKQTGSCWCSHALPKVCVSHHSGQPLIVVKWRIRDTEYQVLITCPGFLIDLWLCAGVGYAFCARKELTFVEIVYLFGCPTPVSHCSTADLFVTL